MMMPYMFPFTPSKTNRPKPSKKHPKRVLSNLSTAPTFLSIWQIVFRSKHLIHKQCLKVGEVHDFSKNGSGLSYLYDVSNLKLLCN